MAVLKCKMCGGELVLEPDSTIAECEYCGSKQTVPLADDEKKLALFDRANTLRAGCAFDKAAGLYEAIVTDFPEEAEAYWGLVLCKFGIEYVDDPATGKKIPTCHRSSFDSVLSDANYEQALEYAYPAARKVYRAEARQIEDIREGIIEVSASEDPYDIFICYKEKDSRGERTPDSVLAQEIYDALTGKGYRVFFSRITMERKLGARYEPYIFAALNSAKIMLVVGMDPSHYQAVWVRNEWSRFLKLIEKGQKKELISCFKGIDPSQMPPEISRLQSQDMGKIGAMQDLLWGIEKILPRSKPADAVQETIVVGNGSSNKIAALLDRGNMALEDGDWAKADSFFEDVLNNDSRNAQAYLGKALVSENCRSLNEFVRKRADATKASYSIEKTIRLKEKYSDHITEMVTQFRIENYLSDNDIQEVYQSAHTYHSDLQFRTQQKRAEDEYWYKHKYLSRAIQFGSGSVAADIENAKQKLFVILDDRITDSGKQDIIRLAQAEKACLEDLGVADTQVKSLFDKANQSRAEKYESFLQIFDEATRRKDFQSLEYLAEKFDFLTDYSDSKTQAEKCRELAETLKRADTARRSTVSKCIWMTILLTVFAICLYFFVILPSERYQTAEELLSNGKIYDAAIMFESCANYSDARERCFELWEQIMPHQTIAAGGGYTVALKEDGTVVAVGNNRDEGFDLFNRADLSALISGDGDYHSDGACDISGWNDIVSLAAGASHTIGLKADGTVVATGNSKNGRCGVQNWKDIVAVSAGTFHTVGLKADGTVVAVGDNGDNQLNVSEWTDIIAVSAGLHYTVGLRADGTVVIAGNTSANQRKASSWKDIVAIYAGEYHMVGLKSDGSVVTAGNNRWGENNTSNWTNIIAVSAGYSYTLGLRTDGTVVATGHNDYYQCDVSDWTDIVAIAAGEDHTIGLKSDGTVVAIGSNGDGQCDVAEWTNIRTVG